MRNSKIGFEIVFNDKKIIQKIKEISSFEFKDNNIIFDGHEIGDCEEKYIYINMNTVDVNIDVNSSLLIFNFINENIDNILELRNIFFITNINNKKVIDIQLIFITINRRFNRYNVVKYFEKENANKDMVFEINSLEDIKIIYQDYKVYFYKESIKLNLNTISYNTLILDSQDNIQTYNLISGYLDIQPSNEKLPNRDLFSIIYDIDFKLK